METELLTVAGLAKLYALNENTIYSLIFRNEIPYYRLGKRIIRFDKVEIIKWLENKKNVIKEEIHASKN